MALVSGNALRLLALSKLNKVLLTPVFLLNLRYEVLQL